MVKFGRSDSVEKGFQDVYAEQVTVFKGGSLQVTTLKGGSAAKARGIDHNKAASDGQRY